MARERNRNEGTPQKRPRRTKIKTQSVGEDSPKKQFLKKRVQSDPIKEKTNQYGVKAEKGKK